jgi:hypothetical protein
MAVARAFTVGSVGPFVQAIEGLQIPDATGLYST